MKEIKTKKTTEKNRCIKRITLIVICIGVGFFIAYFGNGNSYIEDKESFISIIVTLFGLCLTSAIFVAQTIDEFEFAEEKKQIAIKLKDSLASALGTMGVLILTCIIFEFLLSLVLGKVNEREPIIWLDWTIFFINVLLYTLFAAIVVLQIDITGCFLQIMKLRKTKDKDIS